MPGRDRDVLADDEGFEVGHLHLQLAVAALEVVEQVFEALDQVLAAAFDRRAQHLGVGQHEVRRRHRVDELPRVEVDLLLRLRVDVVDVGDGALHPLRGEQVGLLDEVEERVLLPGRVFFP